MQISRILGQVALYALFIAFIGYFATSPAYTFLPQGQALIKLTFSHAGQRKQPCRERSAEELAEMPKHLRKKRDCIYSATISPSGLSHDLASPVYERIRLPAGEHRLQVSMRDDIHSEGYNYTLDRVVTMLPAQILVIDFDSENGKFSLE
jgi:hypothetical protein